METLKELVSVARWSTQMKEEEFKIVMELKELEFGNRNKSIQILHKQCYMYVYFFNLLDPFPLIFMPITEAWDVSSICQNVCCIQKEASKAPRIFLINMKFERDLIMSVYLSLQNYGKHSLDRKNTIIDVTFGIKIIGFARKLALKFTQIE